jgi:hypothetical protein
VCEIRIFCLTVLALLLPAVLNIFDGQQLGDLARPSRLRRARPTRRCARSGRALFCRAWHQFGVPARPKRRVDFVGAETFMPDLIFS